MTVFAIGENAFGMAGTVQQHCNLFYATTLDRETMQGINQIKYDLC